MRALFVAALFLLAGCSASDTEVPNGGPAASAPTTQALAAPAIPDKPSASQGPASAAPASSSAAPAAAEPSGSGQAVEGPVAPATVTDKVDWTGTLGMSQCADSPVGYACFFNGPSPTNPLADSANILHYYHERTGLDIAGGELTFTWDATTSPGTKSLAIALYLAEGCPDDCEAVEVLFHESVTSPATISLSAGKLGPDQVIGIQVMPSETAAGVHMSQGQDVAIKGTLTFYADMAMTTSMTTNAP